MGFTLTHKQRLTATIAISFSFFVAEITVAFMTKSLALLADAFHYMNDLVGFIVALVAVIISERAESPTELSFGWQRARLLGAFFNGAFLLALGVSIFLQSIERFVSLQKVENPKLVLIVGCVGLALNILSAAFLHEHDHGDGAGHGHHHAHNDESDHGHHHAHNESDHGHAHVEDDSALHQSHAEHRHMAVQSAGAGRDLNMLGALVHVLGDAVNNVGVIISAAVIWQTHYAGRYYADPAVSMGIAIMILVSSIPLVKNSGKILLESAPAGVDMDDVKHDLEKIPGIESVHELHIWRLDQKKAIASAHVVVSDQTVSSFMEKARTVAQCLHAYGVHSATLQPELSYSSQASLASLASLAGTASERGDGEALQALPVVTTAADGEVGVELGGLPAASAASAMSATLDARSSQTNVSGTSAFSGPSTAVSALRRRRAEAGCQIQCGTLCENLMCCK